MENSLVPMTELVLLRYPYLAHPISSHQTSHIYCNSEGNDLL